MIMRPRLAPRLLALLVGPGFLFVLGCSDDGLGKRYQVTGKVTYKGAAVESGSISFVPEAPDGHGAAGQIKDGTYTLTTLGENDGALPAAGAILCFERVRQTLTVPALSASRHSR